MESLPPPPLREGAADTPHSPGMAVVGLGQLRGVADGIAFALQPTAREENS